MQLVQYSIRYFTPTSNREQRYITCAEAASAGSQRAADQAPLTNDAYISLYKLSEYLPKAYIAL